MMMPLSLNPLWMAASGGWCGAKRVKKRPKKHQEVQSRNMQPWPGPSPDVPMPALQQNHDGLMHDVSLSDVNGSGASPAPTDSALSDRVKQALERQAKIETLFQLSSGKAVDKKMLAVVASFPSDGDGKFVWPESETSYCAMKRRIEHFLVLDQIQNGSRACKVWPGMISGAYPWMATWTLCDQLLALIGRVIHHRKAGRSWCDYLEFFCGVGNLSRAAIGFGLRGLSFDIMMNQDHDALSGEGLALMLTALSATRHQALVWHGTPCGSFSVMSRATSLRSATNSFLGDPTLAFVATGNGLCDVSALTVFLGHMCGCLEVLEQSGTSCLPQTPPMLGVLAFIAAQKTVTYHACFGADSLKPFQLWSGHTVMSSLQRSKPAGTFGEELVVRGENGRFTGIGHKLQQSQVYSLEFGRAIISSFLAFGR